jgi:hypothetical protein
MAAAACDQSSATAVGLRGDPPVRPEARASATPGRPGRAARRTRDRPRPLRPATRPASWLRARNDHRPTSVSRRQRPHLGSARRGRCRAEITHAASGELTTGNSPDLVRASSAGIWRAGTPQRLQEHREPARPDGGWWWGGGWTWPGDRSVARARHQRRAARRENRLGGQPGPIAPPSAVWPTSPPRANPTRAEMTTAVARSRRPTTSVSNCARAPQLFAPGVSRRRRAGSNRGTPRRAPSPPTLPVPGAGSSCRNRFVDWCAARRTDHARVRRPRRCRSARVSGAVRRAGRPEPGGAVQAPR